jgi:hypothetical protein
MKNSIKIKRAQAMTNFLPEATKHILNNIPNEVKSALTSKQLAQLMDAMHKHFCDGKLAAETEIHDYIGLPATVNLWAVIGDDDYLGIAHFSDGLNIPNILEKRGAEVVKFEKEAKK